MVQEQKNAIVKGVASEPGSSAVSGVTFRSTLLWLIGGVWLLFFVFVFYSILNNGGLY